MSNRVEIFDTTLRDGEQSPGMSMHQHEKIRMARQLERLGVNTIEAGFPIASEQEFEAVRRVAGEIKACRVAALARALPTDIERAAQALEHAEKPTLHTFIASSDIHLKDKLRMTRQQVLEAAHNAVTLAKQLVPPRVEFSAEDATRSDWDFLVALTKVAIEAGADIINLPDTVGYTTPGEIKEMFEYVIGKTKNVPGAERVIFSSHNHNDLGLAVANALAAAAGGARQVECTVSGIGERAGNTSLEEFVMALRVRQDSYPFETDVVTTEIVPSSTLLSKITGMAIPYNKPIVGRNAFAHESGIHQHGVIANARTYEIMTPDSVGLHKSQLVLGKHSGRAGLAKRCEELGYKLSADDLQKLYEKFIDLTAKKKEVYDEDLVMLIVSAYDEEFQAYQLDQVRISGGVPALAYVKVIKGDQPVAETATGDGPVDAAFRAVEKIVNVVGRLEQFEIRATTPGKEALGEAYVTVNFDGKDYRGKGADTDIIVAAVKAYMDAANMYIALKGTMQQGAAAV
ncbi:MAG TPA: 2-isopropylmalate synthase [Candidatus Hydrogenedentes bacterium]|nr:2-isopropylmalate synthase [Candidatus Hydrogenedentota bacterium]HNT86456.1 2-isopropylmalate synthase [Candidatus Hydrogenedentota bacterium]